MVDHRAEQPPGTKLSEAYLAPGDLLKLVDQVVEKTEPVDAGNFPLIGPARRYEVRHKGDLLHLFIAIEAYEEIGPERAGDPEAKEPPKLNCMIYSDNLLHNNPRDPRPAWAIKLYSGDMAEADVQLSRLRDERDREVPNTFSLATEIIGKYLVDLEAAKIQSALDQ